MSPRSQEANRRVRDERREKIIEAALLVFARQGYAAAKISDIATQAGVSYGLVDHYFGKKEDIYIAVVKRAFEGALMVMEDSRQMAGSAWERLHLIYARIFGGIQESPEYILLLNQINQIEAIPEETKTLLHLYEKRSLEIQVELVRQGQESGDVVAGDPLELVIALTGAVQGLAMLRSDERRYPQEFQEHFPQVDTILRMLKHPIQ